MPGKQTLYIMCGLGFAGKSTLAKKISDHTGAILVSQDALFFENKTALNYSELSTEQQWEWLLGLCKSKIKEYLNAGHSVVFDNTNFRFSHREDLRDIAKQYGTQSLVVYLNTPDISLLKRQERNKVTKERHDVNQENLNQERDELEVPGAEENVIEFTPEMDMNVFLNLLERH